MRIALLSDGIYPYVIGGMQKHSFYLASYLAKNKVEIDLYHTAATAEKVNGLDCFTEEEKKYIHSIFIPFPQLDKFPGHYIREMYAYSKEIYTKMETRPNVDFVYVQGLCGLYLLENRARKKVATGINFHGLEMFQKTATLKTKLEQYLFRSSVTRSMKNADVVFSLGGKLTGIIKSEGVLQENIIEIPIGVDDSWLKTQELTVSHQRKFVFVGRYERRKGIEELTKVLQELLLMNLNFCFEFIGFVPEDKIIKSRLVTYHGSLSDPRKIQEILSQSDVLVCPSYSEGMPTVILEAMASGMAIIASNVGAVSEQVDETNGLLVGPGNKKQLKEAIMFFIKQPEIELLRMKQHSIDKVKQFFLWDTIISKTIKEISRVISR